MLVHDGALKREGDRWTTGVELAPARDAAHDPGAARRAASSGCGPRSALCSSAPRSSAGSSRAPPSRISCRARSPISTARLEALRRSELIEPDTGWFLGEPVLRFHHVLIRDAAYRAALEEHARRAARPLRRLARGAGRRRGRARRDDRLAPRAGAPAPRASSGRSTRSGRAPRRAGGALPRGGGAGARSRATTCRSRRACSAARSIGSTPTDPARADLALDWCEALLAAGDVGPAAAAIDELGRFTGDVRAPARVAHLLRRPARRAHRPAGAARHRRRGRGRGRDAGRGRRRRRRGEGPLRARDRARARSARSARARPRSTARSPPPGARTTGGASNAVLAGAPLAALWGPSPVTRASGRCLDVVRVLRITQGAPAVEAVALRCQGVLEALRGRTEAARRMIASSRRMVEELGITQRLLEADVFAGLIELLEGDAAAAERSSARGVRGTARARARHRRGAGGGAARPRAPRRSGRAAEAEALSHESEALAGDDLQAAIAWRGVRAEALARRGEHAAAVDFARAAVEHRRRDRRAARSRRRPPRARRGASRAAGRSDEAAAEEARAIELWEAKARRCSPSGPTAMPGAPSQRRGHPRIARGRRAGAPPRCARMPRPHMWLVSTLRSLPETPTRSHPVRRRRRKSWTIPPAPRATGRERSPHGARC